MDAAKIAAVQNSFNKVAPIAATAAELFYGRLFELDPELRPLFKGDMAKQGDKLMTTLAIAVRGLTNLDSIVPVVKRQISQCLDMSYLFLVF